MDGSIQLRYLLRINHVVVSGASTEITFSGSCSSEEIVTIHKRQGQFRGLGMREGDSYFQKLKEDDALEREVTCVCVLGGAPPGREARENLVRSDILAETKIKMM